MRIRVIGFGTNWWSVHSRDLEDSFCFRRRAAWFNSAGLRSGRRLRLCWVYPGQVRFIRTVASIRSTQCGPLEGHL
jgi:hypothetical protein